MAKTPFDLLSAALAVSDRCDNSRSNSQSKRRLGDSDKLRLIVWNRGNSILERAGKNDRMPCVRNRDIAHNLDNLRSHKWNFLPPPCG